MATTAPAMLYMRWAALPMDPVAARQHWQRIESRYLVERPLLHTSLAADGDDQTAVAAALHGCAGRALPDYEPRYNAVNSERTGVQHATRVEGHPVAVGTEPNGSPKGAFLGTCQHPGSRRCVSRCGHNSDAGRPSSGRRTRTPKPPSEEEAEKTRRWLQYALHPQCTCADYIARALRAADGLGPAVVELQCLRGLVEKKYAQLAMPYVDYVSYLQNSGTGLTVVKPI